MAPGRGWGGSTQWMFPRGLDLEVRTPGCGMKGTLLLSTERTLGAALGTVHVNSLCTYRSEKMISYFIKWTATGAKGRLLTGEHCNQDRSPFLPGGKPNNTGPVKT